MEGPTRAIDAFIQQVHVLCFHHWPAIDADADITDTVAASIMVFRIFLNATKTCMIASKLHPRSTHIREVDSVDRSGGL